MADSKIPDPKTIEFLYNGLLNFYPDVAKQAFRLKGSFGFHDFWGGFKRMDFLDFVLNTTDSSSIEDAAYTIKAWKEGGLSERTVPTNIDALVQDLQTKEAEKASAYDKSVAAKKALLESQKHKERYSQTTRKTQIGQSPTKIENKKIYYNSPEKIETPPLNKEAQENLNKLVEAAKKDPAAFAQKLNQSIVEELNNNKYSPQNPELTKNNAQLVSIDLTNKIMAMDQTEGSNIEKLTNIYLQDTLHQVLPLTNPDNLILSQIISDQTKRISLAKSAQETVVLLDNDYSLSKTYLSAIVDKQILEYLYPGLDNNFKYDLSTTEGPKTVFNVNPQNLSQDLSGFSSESEIVINQVQNRAFGYLKNKITDVLSNTINSNPLLKNFSSQTLTNYEVLFSGKFNFGGSFLEYSPSAFTYFSAKGIPAFAFSKGAFSSLGGINATLSPIVNWNLGKIAGFSRAAFSTTNGLAGEVFGLRLGKFALTLTKTIGQTGSKWAINLLSNVAAKGLTSAITAGGTTAAGVVGGAGAGAIAGSVVPVVGTIVGAIVGFFGGKIIEPIIRWIKNNKEVSLALLAVPLLIIKAPLILALSPALLAALAALGSKARVRGGLIAAILAGLGLLFAEYIFITLILTFGLLILTAIILFIINSGAYVTPSSQAFPNINPYMRIEKTIEPTGATLVSYENSDLPETVTYKIRLTPLKTDLTHVKFKYDCKVINRNSTSECPNIEGDFPSGDIGTVKLGEPYEFTYSHTFTSPVYDNTLNMDTVTVTADVPGYVSGSSVYSFASVKIGDPPVACPSIWPIEPENGEVSLSVPQGPLGAYSHSRGVEAIDVIAVPGHTIRATHSGVANVVYTTNAYRPLYVDLASVCDGNEFTSRYAHLLSAVVTTGEKVEMGQIIGYSGSDGDGPHLHYEFRGLLMQPPYIPKVIPRYCSGFGDACGTIP